MSFRHYVPAALLVLAACTPPAPEVPPQPSEATSAAAPGPAASAAQPAASMTPAAPAKAEAPKTAAAFATPEGGEKAWTYPEMNGATNTWGKDYPFCEGGQQSPIVLDPKATAKPGVTVDLKESPFSAKLALNVDRADHNFKFTPDAKTPLTITVKDGKASTDLTVVGVHFHIPSEHVDAVTVPIVNWKVPLAHAMEMHVVTKDAKEDYSVFAVRIDGDKPGTNSDWFAPIVNMVYGGPAETFDFGTALSAFKSSAFYSYPGSLTTPPCRQEKDKVVTFYVLKDAMKVSSDILMDYASFFGMTFQLRNNARGTHATAAGTTVKVYSGKAK